MLEALVLYFYQYFARHIFFDDIATEIVINTTSELNFVRTKLNNNI